MDEERREKVRTLARLLEESRHTVALTGAGVSTESGIPDFRSPGSGLWTKVNVELFTIEGFKANPGAFYENGQPFVRLLAGAEPNLTHRALAELERSGHIKAVITQNVDGLHQKGGSKRVLQIHGSLDSASCLHCRRKVPIEEVASDLEEGLLPPLCLDCGEPLKPDVVLFGEPLAPDYREALTEAKQADLILVLGSSMQVSPANEIPSLARRLAIINRTATFYDKEADVVINDRIAGVMEQLMTVLRH